MNCTNYFDKKINIQEAICTMETKINELVEMYNRVDIDHTVISDKIKELETMIDYLTKAGLEIEIRKQLEAWLADGTFDHIIGNLLNDLTSKVTQLDSKIDNISNNNEYISVRFFGAVGDAITDDTDAFLTAIEYCKNNKKNLYIPPSYYIISKELVIDFNGFCIRGGGRDYSTLISKTNDFNIITINGSRYNSIEELTIYNMRSGDGAVSGVNNTSIGIKSKNTHMLNLRNIWIHNCKTGVLLDAATNTSAENIVVSATNKSPGQNGYMIVNGCVSSYFYRCIASLTYAENSTGYNIGGNRVADLNFINCGGSNMTRGVWINGANSTNPSYPNTDINFYNTIFDGTTNNAFYIVDTGKNVAINIEGGWINNLVSATSAAAICCHIVRSEGVTINNVNFQCINQIYAYTKLSYINITQSTNCKVVNCTLVGGQQPIVVSSNSKAILINANTFYNNYSNYKVDTAINLYSCLYSSSTNNIVDGYFINGIKLGVGATKCMADSNIVTDLVTTKITNSSADSILGTNITT